MMISSGKSRIWVGMASGGKLLKLEFGNCFLKSSTKELRREGERFVIQTSGQPSAKQRAAAALAAPPAP